MEKSAGREVVSGLHLIGDEHFSLDTIKSIKHYGSFMKGMIKLSTVQATYEIK